MEDEDAREARDRERGFNVGFDGAEVAVVGKKDVAFFVV
jgi:hypothetical protein